MVEAGLYSVAVLEAEGVASVVDAAFVVVGEVVVNDGHSQKDHHW